MKEIRKDTAGSADIREKTIRELHKLGNATIDPRTGKPAKFAIALNNAEFLAALQRKAWRQDQTPQSATASKPALSMTDAEFATAMKNKAWRRQ